MVEQPAVLITDAVHPLLLEGLQQAGYYCVYQPDIAASVVLNTIKDYVGIVINSKILVDKKFLDRAPKLEFVARLGSGLEIIDLDYARQKGVLVHRSPDGNCDAVAEHAIGMLLALANNLCRGNQEVRQKIWQREANRGWELMGKTVGIIGFGYTGSAFAKRLSGFGVEILAYDKYKSGYAKNLKNVLETDLEQIVQKADIISLHLPLTTETRYWADDAFFDKLEKPIVLVNSSRGAVLNTASLLNALDKGIVIGACLDVFENEKPKTYSEEQEKLFADLFARENIILTPHVAGWTRESKERLSKLLLDRILGKEKMR